MKKQRTQRVNSLLKEVLSEVINKDIHNPMITEFITITNVDVSKDLHHATVSISVIGDDKLKLQMIEILQKNAKYIGVVASKKVALRYFPSLHFAIDNTVDQQIRIEKILHDIDEEKKSRPSQ